MDDETPRKSEKVPARSQLQVLVDSPPHLRPKQRLRKNEAGDAVNLSDDPGPVASATVPAPWVGTGEVSPEVFYPIKNTAERFHTVALCGM